MCVCSVNVLHIQGVLVLYGVKIWVHYTVAWGKFVSRRVYICIFYYIFTLALFSVEEQDSRQRDLDICRAQPSWNVLENHFSIELDFPHTLRRTT